MAFSSVRSVGSLDAGRVLAPERYDPRRGPRASTPGVPLLGLAQLVRESVAPGKAALDRYVVLDTGDARGGVATGKRAVPAEEIGSAKKLARPGDVIVSRLRPYLRQVALVDAELLARDPGAGIGCSTEFHVLRGRDDRSIAFLVAFLLGEEVQATLAAGQEGGHHPRFHQALLEGLVVPTEVVATRDALSARVEAAVAAARRSERELEAAIAEAGGAAGELPRLAA